MGEEEGRAAGDRAPEEEEFTKDGSVDLKGRPSVRSKSGRWKACSFIVDIHSFTDTPFRKAYMYRVLHLRRCTRIGYIYLPGYEIFERMAYYGIVSNLVVYLTGQLHEGTVKSANNVTNWAGTVWMLPVLGAYIADAHLGRYWTFMISSAIYIAGMCLLTLTVSLPSLKPPSDSPATPFQVGIFYAALYTIAVGTGGTKPNISTMGADQFDDFEPKERGYKLSFYNWWMFSIFIGALFANTFLVYVQDNVGWGLGYGLPTIGLAFSIVVFVIGTPFYRHKRVSDSSYTRMVQVFVAAIRKRSVPVPADPKELHELDFEEYRANNTFRIDHTSSLRLLDKAATKSGPSTPWTLCTVTQVEETKQIIKLLPVLLVTFIPSVMYAQIPTLFVKQGTTLDLSMGPHFKIPPASLAAFVTIFMLITIPVYDRLLVPALRRYTKNPRGITMLQRLGCGIVIHVVVMLVAFLAERKRLGVVREEGIVDAKAKVPLTIFVLLPQYALMGVADAFVLIPQLEFFYDQAPEGMKSLGTSFFSTGLGVGNFLSSFILSTVSDYTKRGGRKGWIQNNLNTSRMDYYYLLFALLSVANLLVYIVVTKLYVYNTDVVQTEIDELRKAKEEDEAEGQAIAREF